jgi:hypothetical protein
MPASSDDESLEPPASGIASDTEEDVDSDGPYAFRRKKNCDSFLAVCYFTFLFALSTIRACL